MKPRVDRNLLSMPSCGRAEALGILERKADYIQSVASWLLTRLRVDESIKPTQGCAHCRSEILHRPPSLAKRCDVLGLLLETVQSGTVAYRSADLYQCAECHAHWLDYFEEVNSAETLFEESGHVLRRIVALEQADVRRIQHAVEDAALLSSLVGQEAQPGAEEFFFGNILNSKSEGH